MGICPFFGVECKREDCQMWIEPSKIIVINRPDTQDKAGCGLMPKENRRKL